MDTVPNLIVTSAGQKKKCREVVYQAGCEVLVLTVGKDGALL